MVVWPAVTAGAMSSAAVGEIVGDVLGRDNDEVICLDTFLVDIWNRVRTEKNVSEIHSL